MGGAIVSDSRDRDHAPGATVDQTIGGGVVHTAGGCGDGIEHIGVKKQSSGGEVGSSRRAISGVGSKDERSRKRPEHLNLPGLGEEKAATGAYVHKLGAGASGGDVKMTQSGEIHDRKRATAGVADEQQTCEGRAHLAESETCGGRVRRSGEHEDLVTPRIETHDITGLGPRGAVERANGGEGERVDAGGGEACETGSSRIKNLHPASG